MSIKKIQNYNTGMDLSTVSISEATYMLNSFIEESINDIHTRCLLTDKRSIQESGVLYFLVIRLNRSLRPYGMRLSESLRRLETSLKI